MNQNQEEQKTLQKNKKDLKVKLICFIKNGENTRKKEILTTISI